MRRVGVVGFLCLVVLSTMAAVGSSAHAFTVICSGTSKSSVAKCDRSGYAEVMHRMHWRMYGGHNCTNYAAYRMQKAGVPEPRILMGNARDWATNAKKLGYAVDQRPAVGAIAQWSKRASHVAYVEEVGSNYLILSEDSYTSKVYRRYKVLTGASWYPERFIHFKDVTAPTTPTPSPAPAPPAVTSSIAVSTATKVFASMRPTVAVTVRSSNGTVPTGTVRVRRGGVTVAKATLTAAAKGAVTVTLPRLSVGTQWISAVFDGNTKVRASTSSSARLVVARTPRRIASRTSITPSAAQITAPTRATVRLAVTTKDQRTVTNAVSLYLNGKRIAAPVLRKRHRGVVTVTLPALAPGTYRLTATYWGRPTVKRSQAAARTLKVVEPTTTSATLLSSRIRAGAAATVDVGVTTARGVVPTSGRVWAAVDGVRAPAVALTPASNGRARLTLPGIAAGRHQVTVGYDGATHQLASASAPLALNVAQTTATSLSGPASVAKGKRAKVTVRLRTASGAASAGVVRILEGSTVRATVSVPASGAATVTLPVLAVGTHRLTASFAATDLLEASTSSVYALKVTK